MNINRYDYYKNYWRKLYWSRYNNFYPYDDQPDRFLFKRKIKLLEKWIGKQSEGNIRDHFLYQTFTNLTSWSSNWFIYFIEILEEIEIKNEVLFKALTNKLASNKFSWEVNELVSEIAFLKNIIKISEIEIDPVLENDLQPDILIRSEKFGRTIIELTRLSDSQEYSFCRECIQTLEKLDFIVNFVTYAYRFHRSPTKEEWASFIKIIDEKLIYTRDYILEKNEFITLIIVKSKQPDFETFKMLCSSEKLSYGERAGWPIANITHERIIKKAKKKEKYAKVGIDYVLSIYGIADLFFVYGKEKADEILNEIVEMYKYPVKFNYWYMFENENYAKNMKNFIQINLKLSNSISVSSFFKNYNNIEQFPLLNALRQNFV